MNSACTEGGIIPASLSGRVPGWVRWLAQDSDGSWWGYSVEPLRHDAGWYENEVGRHVRLGCGEPRGWETSLVRHVPPQR